MKISIANLDTTTSLFALRTLLMIGDCSKSVLALLASNADLRNDFISCLNEYITFFGEEPNAD